MVSKIQLNDIDFDNCVCIKDKYDRIVNGVNQGRSIHYDKGSNIYYKLFHPEYCRVETMIQHFYTVKHLMTSKV